MGARKFVTLSMSISIGHGSNQYRCLLECEEPDEMDAIDEVEKFDKNNSIERIHKSKSRLFCAVG